MDFAVQLSRAASLSRLPRTNDPKFRAGKSRSRTAEDWGNRLGLKSEPSALRLSAGESGKKKNSSPLSGSILQR
jgi:hypothetical protein